MSRTERFSRAIAASLLVVLTAGCATAQNLTESVTEITQSERERLATSVPQGWRTGSHPEMIAKISKLHVVGKVISIGMPVAPNGADFEYVPIRVYCMQGPFKGEFTFRIIPEWDEFDSILRLQVGQRLLLSGTDITEDNSGLVGMTANNVYLIDDNQTMRLLDEPRTVVGSLSKLRKLFALD